MIAITPFADRANPGSGLRRRWQAICSLAISRGAWAAPFAPAPARRCLGR